MSTGASRRPGPWELVGLPGEEATFTARHDRLGFALARLRPEAGRTNEWNPVLTTGAGLSGDLADGSGHPLEGWSITVRDPAEGDARETLRDIDGGVDFFHNDGFPRFALPVLQLLAPKMEPGAVTLCGNAALFPADHAEYVAWVRQPENGFVSAPLPMKVGGEFSIRAPQGTATGTMVTAAARSPHVRAS